MANWIVKKYGSVTIIFTYEQVKFLPILSHLTNLSEIWYSDGHTLLEGHK